MEERNSKEGRTREGNFWNANFTVSEKINDFFEIPFSVWYSKYHSNSESSDLIDNILNNVGSGK